MIGEDPVKFSIRRRQSWRLNIRDQAVWQKDCGNLSKKFCGGVIHAVSEEGTTVVLGGPR